MRRTHDVQRRFLLLSANIACSYVMSVAEWAEALQLSSTLAEQEVYGTWNAMVDAERGQRGRAEEVNCIAARILFVAIASRSVVIASSPEGVQGVRGTWRLVRSKGQKSLRGDSDLPSQARGARLRPTLQSDAPSSHACRALRPRDE